MKRILIVDDELDMLESLKKILSFKDDFSVTAINSPKEALSVLSQSKFDVVLTDLKMGEISGLDILKSALKKHPTCVVIIISGYGTIEASVDAVKFGAFDFIEKPFTSKKLFETIERGLEAKGKEFGVETLEDDQLEGIIYKSNEMRDVIKLVKRIAPGDMNILLVGESGTGKDLIARAIHNLSKGISSPFVPVNCGALPESLFESELFGHEKGAFTGAVKTKPGLLEFAKDGTFFFDEIAEMSPALQVKLLRMLEEHKIRRVGGQSEIDISVRIIAATNKNLDELVRTREFREDLFYRLNNFKIEIPPLRERPDDIIPLINYFMYKFCAVGGELKKRFTPDAEETLKSYSWPGNIRELQNLVRRAYYLCATDMIRVEDLPIANMQKQQKNKNEILDYSFKEAKEKVIEQFEIEYLTHRLKLNDGNISKTADECGIDRRTIHRLISKYNIVHRE